MHPKEKTGHMPSSEAGPHPCGEPRHRYNKWAARKVTYPDGKVKCFCLWCFGGVRKNIHDGTSLRVGTKVTALLPRLK